MEFHNLPRGVYRRLLNELNTNTNVATGLLSCLLVSNLMAADTAEDQYAVAARHYERGRWELAAAEFRSFLTTFPTHPRADTVRFFLGESLVQAERYAEARAELKAFAEESPDHPFSTQAAFRWGEAAFLQKDYAAARPALVQFHKRHPHHVLNGYALPYLAEIALARGNPGQAEDHYRAAVQRFPRGPLVKDCHLGLARIAADQGRILEAIGRYEQLTESTDPSTSDLAQLNLAVLHYKSGAYESSLQQLDKLEGSLNPEHPLRIEGHYWRAEAYRALGKWTEAEEQIRAASEESLGHPLANAIAFSLAEVLRAGASPSEAYAQYERVRQNWPDGKWADDAHQIQIELKLEAGEHVEAQRLARDFLDTYPDSERRLRVGQLLARSLLNSGDYSQAIEALNAIAPDGDPSSENPLRAHRRSEFTRWNSYYKGLAYIGDKRYMEALAELELVEPQHGEQGIGGQHCLGARLCIRGHGAFSGSNLATTRLPCTQAARRRKLALPREAGRRPGRGRRFGRRHRRIERLGSQPARRTLLASQ